MIYILIGFIFLIYLVRKSNTDDLIKQANIITEDQKNKLDEETLKYKTTKFSCLLFAIALISLVAVAAIRLTSLEVEFLDYFGTGINHKEIYIPLIWYITPFFVLVVRGIIIEVNLGDYILKTYNLKEEEIDTKEALNAVKGLLYKKAPTSPTPVTTTETQVTQESTTPQPIPTVTEPIQSTTPQPIAPVIPEATENKAETLEETQIPKESNQPTPVANTTEEKANVNPFAI